MGATILINESIPIVYAILMQWIGWIGMGSIEKQTFVAFCYIKLTPFIKCTRIKFTKIIRWKYTFAGGTG